MSPTKLTPSKNPQYGPSEGCLLGEVDSKVEFGPSFRCKPDC